MSTGKVIAIIGFTALAALGVWNAAPLFYNKQVNEDLPTGTSSQTATVPAVMEPAAGGDTATSTTSTQVLSEGTFAGADSFHQAAGTVQVVGVDGKKYVRFEENFSVTNGPDLYVYFGKDGKPDLNVSLGRLKGNQGSQNYEIPDTVSLSDYNQVWVWCRAFSVPFGSASI